MTDPTQPKRPRGRPRSSKFTEDEKRLRHNAQIRGYRAANRIALQQTLEELELLRALVADLTKPTE